MADDRPEDIEPPPDSGRAKRAPPTIDLEATEVSSDSQDSAAGAEPERSLPRRSAATISHVIIAAISGAGAAALVIGAAWLAGWPMTTSPTAPAPQVNAAAVDDLAARLASVESRVSEPAAAAPDPASAARAEALEKSLAALRDELASQRAQAEKLASAVDDVKSAPREAAPSPDLSAINERIAGIELAARAQSAEITRETSKPADDVPLRRIVAAALLDVLVRIGDPYPAALSAAKTLAPDSDALKPLEGFAWAVGAAPVG